MTPASASRSGASSSAAGEEAPRGIGAESRGTGKAATTFGFATGFGRTRAGRERAGGFGCGAVVDAGATAREGFATGAAGGALVRAGAGCVTASGAGSGRT